MTEIWGQLTGRADTAKLIAVVDQLWRAIAHEDHAALETLLVAGKQLDLVWDLWGWPGVRLVTAWTPEMINREVGLDANIGDARSLALSWETSSGEARGASFWFAEEPELRLLDALPSAIRSDAAYDLAMEKGLTPPWRAPAPDPVEAKLRQAVAARKYPMDAQATIINMWRRHAPLVDPSQARPEVWAAAVEGGYWQSQGRDMTPAQMADLYGARKGDVKRCFETLTEASKRL